MEWIGKMDIKKHTIYTVGTHSNNDGYFSPTTVNANSIIDILP